MSRVNADGALYIYIYIKEDPMWREWNSSCATSSMWENARTSIISIGLANSSYIKGPMTGPTGWALCRPRAITWRGKMGGEVKKTPDDVRYDTWILCLIGIDRTLNIFTPRFCIMSNSSRLWNYTSSTVKNGKLLKRHVDIRTRKRNQVSFSFPFCRET